MYCSLDKIDLSTQVEGRPVAVQTDHRSRTDIEAEAELSALFAMTRVLNARAHFAEAGHLDTAVHYVVAGELPACLRDALCAVGAVIQHAPSGHGLALEPLGPPSPERIAEVADRSFGELARRAAARVGTRDLAMALRMLEDQTFADPPPRDDPEQYWARVLELAALAGELLRAKFPSVGWVQTDGALVPFGFQLAATASGSSTVVYPTNRAQRVIEDGRDETLFKLLLATEEQRSSDAAPGRLMPSLRDRRIVELDNVVWRSVLPESAGPPDLPIIICGIDGENTFGVVQREALDVPADEAMSEALRNLEAEAVQTEELHADDVVVLVVTGSFYAAEKLLDRTFMLSLHQRLDAELLAAAVPTRGLLMVTAAHHDAPQIARFAALARLRHDDGGGRALSPTVLLVSDGRVVGFVRDVLHERTDTEAGERWHPGEDTKPETPGAREDGDVKPPGLIRRLLGRK